MDICTFLSATSLFSALEPATVQRLAACCRMETYPEGATMFVAGDPGDEMFVVVSGSVKVLVPSEDGDITLATFSHGDTFGELALLEVGGRRSATAVAVEPSDRLVVARHDVNTILRSSPDFLYRQLCKVAMRLRRTNRLCLAGRVSSRSIAERRKSARVSRSRKTASMRSSVPAGKRASFPFKDLECNRSTASGHPLRAR